MIPLFWTSSDVCSGFQSQCRSLTYVLRHLYAMESSDSSLVRHLLTSWRPAWCHVVYFLACHGWKSPFLKKSSRGFPFNTEALTPSPAAPGLIRRLYLVVPGPVVYSGPTAPLCRELIDYHVSSTYSVRQTKRSEIVRETLQESRVSGSRQNRKSDQYAGSWAQEVDQYGGSWMTM